MKQSTKLKAFALSLIMATCFVMQAQTDNFFRGGDDSYESRADVNTLNGGDPGTGLHNQTFGQEVPTPLGSGLLIMAAAGAGYAVARRKRSLRKGTAMLLALALVLGLTQCKKRVETVATNPSEGVHITLTIDDDSKSFINVLTGEVTYTEGDVIYVGYNGKYCGTLTCNGERFEGTITPDITEDPLFLYFYYTGGILIDEYDLNRSASELGGRHTIDFGWQYGQLRTVSIGHSTQPYSPETTAYHSWLHNKCALVKIVPSIPTSNMIIIETPTDGTFTDNVRVNFAEEKITTFKQGTHTAHPYHRYDNEYWLIIPTQEAFHATVRIPGFYITSIDVPAMEDNAFYTQGITINMEARSDGFTVDSDHNIVYFSKGNLQYLGNADGTGTWRFADNQWDWMGDGPSSGTARQGNVTITGYTDYNYGSGNVVGSETERDKASARDLFGWGTSGYVYQPYTTMGSNQTGWEQHYGGTTDIAGTRHDWGVYHSVGGGGNLITPATNDHWRTLTSEEWNKVLLRSGYVYTTETNVSSKTLCAKATVMGTKGLLLFPDNWTGRVNGNFLRITYGTSTSYPADNTFDDNTTVTWAQLEALGCVFLPGLAYRDGATIRNVSNQQSQSFWSSSIYSNNTGSAKFMISSSTTLSNSYRYAGRAVRLVKDAN